MSLNKILGTVALTFWIGLSGCTVKYEAYRFNGKIKGEQIIFETNEVQSSLEVIRTDGVRIIYRDHSNNDLKIDRLEMIVNGVTLIYHSKNETDPEDPNWSEVSAEAQKQFDDYLIKIKEEKERIKQRGVEILKSKSIFREGEQK
ncbi:hypothetical protein HZA97_01880 [Candidatus Woesearchaeota archaeon]|nr:hypothetical protein [Candidatus Woesearchaeota archaeon]